MPEPTRGPSPEQGAGRKEPGPARYAGLGVQLLASILLFLWAGSWLDRKLGTPGLFAVVGVMLGFGATLYSLLRSLKRDAEGDDGVPKR